MGTTVVAPQNQVTAVAVTNSVSDVAPATIGSTANLGLWTGVANVKTDYGAKGDGVTDDSTALQNAFTASANGTQVFFPAGNYGITKQLTVAARLWICGQGATITELTPVTGTGSAGGLILLNGTACNGAHVTGLTCAGAETHAGFSGASTKDYCFVYVLSAQNVVIRDVVVTGKSYGIVCAGTVGTRISDCQGSGVLQAPTDPGFNFSAFVKVGVSGGSGCAGVQLRGLVGDHYGDLVLVGTSSVYGTLSDSYCTNMVDSGIYISSGHSWSVTNVHVDQLNSNGGSCFLIRGNNHVLKGCTGSNAVGGNGINITGANGGDDGTGYDGDSTVVIGNTLLNIAHHGLVFGSDSGFFARDCSVLGNTFSNCASAGTSYYPMEVLGAGHSIIGNQFWNTTASAPFVVLINGTSGAPCPNITYSQNKIRAAATGPATAVLASYVTNGNFNGNILVGAGTAGHFDLRNLTNCTISNTQGGTLSFNASFPSTSCQAYANESTYAGDLTNLWAQPVEMASGSAPKNVNFVRAAKTGNYTLTDADTYVPGSAGSGALTLTLPDATTRANRVFVLAKIDASVNGVSVATTSGQTINGIAIWILRSKGECLIVQSNGANWEILGTAASERHLAIGGASITVNVTDRTIVIDATNADANANLPTAASARGQRLAFVRKDSTGHAANINAQTGDGIGPSSLGTLSLAAAGNAAEIQSDGINTWYILNQI